MKRSSKKYAEALLDLTEGKSKKEIGDVIREFVRVLALNNGLSKAQEIIDEYERMADSKNNIVRAKVISAKELENDSFNLVSHFIKEVTKAEEVVLEKEVKKELIGGMVIKYKDKVLDFSLKNKVEELKQILKK